jgi:hypothetical protein
VAIRDCTGPILGKRGLRKSAVNHFHPLPLRVVELSLPEADFAKGDAASDCASPWATVVAAKSKCITG